MEQAFWNFIFSLISAALGSVAGAAIAYLKLKRTKKKQGDEREEDRFKRLEHGQLLLMRSDLIRLHDCFMERGYCAVSVKYSVREEYEGYHALGGNGVATKMLEDIMALPEKKEN